MSHVQMVSPQLTVTAPINSLDLRFYDFSCIVGMGTSVVAWKILSLKQMFLCKLLSRGTSSVALNSVTSSAL